MSLLILPNVWAMIIMSTFLSNYAHLFEILNNVYDRIIQFFHQVMSFAPLLDTMAVFHSNLFVFLEILEGSFCRQ